MDREYLFPELKKNIVLEAVLSVVAVIVIAALAVGIGIANRGNPASYWSTEGSVSYSGYDGYGEIEDSSLFFNYDKFYHSYIGEDAADPDYIDTLEDAIDIDVSKTDGLHNGEKIRVTATIDFDELNEAYPSAKHRQSGEKKYSKTFKVQGLEDITEFNPFSILDHVYVQNSDDGIRYYVSEPRISVGNYYLVQDKDYSDEFNLVDENNEVISSDFFEFDTSESYPKVGQKVRISVDNGDESDAEEYGIAVQGGSELYTVKAS